TVTLSNAQTDAVDGVAILNAEIGGVIENDDAPSVISIQRVARAEEGDAGDANTVDFTLTRDGRTDGEVTVDFVVSVADGTAEAGDLVGGGLQTGQVTFADGADTATISVAIDGDNVIEGTETFSVTLVGLSGDPAQTVFGQQVATGEILNDDGTIPILPIGREADIFGDPHIVTLDGLGYDFQAVGEFTLVEGTDAADPLNVQVRTAPVPGSDLVSVITAMATDMGSGATLMIDAFADPALTVNGAPVAVPESGAEPVDVGDGQVFFDGETYTVVFENGEALTIKINDGSINVCVFLNPARADGSVHGIMGNSDGDFTNDFALRNGDPIPAESISFDPETGAPSLDFDFLYGTYADSWRITDQTSLFAYSGEAGDTGTADYTDQSFPAGVIDLEALPAELLAAAEAAVDAAGITDPILREAALLDFALTGDEQFIEGAAGVAADPEVETDPTEAPDLPDTVGVIADLTSVAEGDEGTTEVSFTFYRIGDAAGPLTVDYQVGGDVDAADFADGEPLSGQIVFADGEDMASLTILLSGDGDVEAAENLTISITPADGEDALIAAPTANTVILTDDAAPVAFDDAFATNEDETLFIDAATLLANDVDGDDDDLSITSVGPTSTAGASVTFIDGVVVYEPGDLFLSLGAEETATDTFSYTITDGQGGFSTATATVTINGVNTAPVAENQSQTTDEDTQFTGALVATDAEDDGLIFELALVGQPENGSVTVTESGSFSVTPADDFNGDFSFI
ncbi:MAG: Ig-like domain-containing protein, partial [Pseudomonadota bacterium]